MELTKQERTLLQKVGNRRKRKLDFAVLAVLMVVPPVLAHHLVQALVNQAQLPLPISAWRVRIGALAFAWCIGLMFMQGTFMAFRAIKGDAAEDLMTRLHERVRELELRNTDKDTEHHLGEPISDRADAV
jgi:hypothetical protein